MSVSVPTVAVARSTGSTAGHLLPHLAVEGPSPLRVVHVETLLRSPAPAEQRWDVRLDGIDHVC